MSTIIYVEYLAVIWVNNISSKRHLIYWVEADTPAPPLPSKKEDISIQKIVVMAILLNIDYIVYQYWSISVFCVSDSEETSEGISQILKDDFENNNLSLKSLISFMFLY